MDALWSGLYRRGVRYIRRRADAINARYLQDYVDSIVFPFTYQNYNGVALTHAHARDVDAKGGALALGHHHAFGSELEPHHI